MVTSKVKAAGACNGGEVGCPVKALYENEMSCPAEESNTSCEAVIDWDVKPERSGVNWGVCSKPVEMAVDIWERNKELIRKRTDIGEHFTREVIQSIIFIFYH